MKIELDDRLSYSIENEGIHMRLNGLSYFVEDEVVHLTRELEAWHNRDYSVLMHVNEHNSNHQAKHNVFAVKYPAVCLVFIHARYFIAKIIIDYRITPYLFPRKKKNHTISVSTYEIMIDTKSQ